MPSTDDDLISFDAEGVALPPGAGEGRVANDGARIWYATWGSGAPVVLLHGGMGHSGNFGKQIAPLVASGYKVIAIDSRGHGRSSRDAKPYSYALMGSDVLAVMDALGIAGAAIIGWSDGACTGLILARQAPARIAGVLYFACNMDPSGTKPFQMTPVIERCLSRHMKDYGALSATPDAFKDFADAVGLMQRTQPNWSAADLAAIRVPVTVVQAEFDEFIKAEHAAYLARTIPGAELVRLPGVSHFAPIQNPDRFNAAVLAFLKALPAT